MTASRAFLTAAICAASLTACTSYRGSDRLTDRLDFQSGTYAEAASRRQGTAQSTAAYRIGLRSIFLEDLQNAYKARMGKAGGLADRDPASLNAKLFSSGVALVRVNCNEYFNEMGRNQRNSGILRDLIAPISSALTTAINLQLFSNIEQTNKDIGLGFQALSNAGTSALDIYDRRFLFSSDNIDAVRSNTMSAIATNAGPTFKTPPTDFVDVVTRLMDVENFCTPAAIVANVRQSIEDAKFKNEPAGGSNGKGGNATAPTPPAPAPAPAPGTAQPVDPKAFVQTSSQ